MSFSVRLSAFLALGASQVYGAKQNIPRATSVYSNSTSTSDASSPTTDIPVCCYLDSFGVGQVLWYTGSVEVTVATVSTIVYQYNNTAITSYSTKFVNNTLPTGLLDRANPSDLISGVPTTIIGGGLGGYQALTTIVTGTVFTDPYGVEYTSPTPAWVYTDVTYRTSMPTPTGGGYACPTYAIGFGSEDVIKPYPSGYYSVDSDPKYGQDNNGELFTMVPEGLKDWLVSHVPPNVDPIWSSIGLCTVGFGDGIPTAHVPVNALTETTVTTTMIPQNYGSVIPSTTPEPVVVPPTPTPVPDIPSSAAPVVVPSQSNPAVNPPATTPNPVVPVSTPAVVPGSTPAVVPLPSAQPGNSQANTALPTSPAMTVAPIITAGGTTIIGNSQSNFVIGSSTLTPGGTVIVPGSGGASPTTFVLPATGSAVIINGATQGIQTSNVPVVNTPAAIFTVGGTTITANSASNFVIGSATLTPGGTIAVSGTTYALPSSGGAVIVNGATQTLITPTPTATTPILVVGSITYTANSGGGFVIGSQTLTSGGVVTASGVVLSLATGGSTLVQISAGTTKTESLGDIIASVGGFSTTPPTATSSSTSEATGQPQMASWAVKAGLVVGWLGVWAL